MITIWLWIFHLLEKFSKDHRTLETEAPARAHIRFSACELDCGVIIWKGRTENIEKQTDQYATRDSKDCSPCSRDMPLKFEDVY
jgi:hypothetical protein